MKSIAGKYAIRFVVAVFVVFLWSAPHLASRLSDRNLYYAAAERQDAWWCMAPLLLYALLAVFASLLVDWSRRAWVERLFRSGFLLLLGGGILTNVVHQLSKLRTYRSPLLDVGNHYAWLFLAALAGYALTQATPRWYRACKNLCLICSPSLLVLVFQLLTGPVYPRRTDPLPATTPTAHAAATARTVSETPSRTAADKPGVYWFIFDEWSYERSYENRRLRPWFRNLQQFSDQATVFHAAQTPGSCTEISIPSMLYMTRLTPFFESGRVGLMDGTRKLPLDEFESVFAEPGRSGYFRALVGFGLAYNQWVGKDLDLCRARGFSDDPRSLSKCLLSHAGNTAQFSADPLMRYIYQRWVQTSPFMPYYRRLHEDMRKDVEWVLTQSPRRTFAVIHYMLPHKPYLFDEHGNERPFSPDMSTERADLYEKHLGCLDLRIGEFLDLLRKSDRFDDSMVIITSDHSWRADPLRHTGDHPINHVPLIIKLPRQTEPRVVDAEFQLYRLGEFIHSCLRGQAATVQQVARGPDELLTLPTRD